MIGFSSRLFALCAALSAVSTVVSLPPDERRNTDAQSKDAPYSVSTSQLRSSLTCPRGIKGAKGGAVLLVHGTLVNANESWFGGPYLKYLPFAGPTFDVCYISIPNYSLGDVQDHAEYVAYNIPVLAKKSATKKVAIIGHSQGAGLNPQWALDFWPSTRQYVSDYVGLAPDFHGAALPPGACTAMQLNTTGCEPASIQQTAGSNLLKAQNKRGGKAFVTTTAIYTKTDDVINPENGTSKITSRLPGAKVIALQDPDVCGSQYYQTHFGMPLDTAAYFLALDALSHSGPASTSRFKKSYCSSYYPGNHTSPVTKTRDQVAAFAMRIMTAGVNVTNTPRVKKEPPLKQYVCDQGQATKCG